MTQPHNIWQQQQQPTTTTNNSSNNNNNNNQNILEVLYPQFLNYQTLLCLKRHSYTNTIYSLLKRVCCLYNLGRSSFYDTYISAFLFWRKSVVISLASAVYESFTVARVDVKIPHFKKSSTPTHLTWKVATIFSTFDISVGCRCSICWAREFYWAVVGCWFFICWARKLDWLVVLVCCLFLVSWAWKSNCLDACCWFLIWKFNWLDVGSAWESYGLPVIWRCL